MQPENALKSIDSRTKRILTKHNLRKAINTNGEVRHHNESFSLSKNASTTLFFRTYYKEYCEQ